MILALAFLVTLIVKGALLTIGAAGERWQAAFRQNMSGATLASL